MMKNISYWCQSLAFIAVAMVPCISMEASVADDYPIDVAKVDGRVGASMPYTRYDSEEAQLIGGAQLLSSPKWERRNLASQASRQSYVSLPSNGSALEWTLKTKAKGVTVRFTMPDSPNGKGLDGTLDVYVDGEYNQTINVSSRYSYQYFTIGAPSDKPNGGVPAFAFDEVHFKLKKELQPGQRIQIRSTGAGGLTYGVDFIETEQIPDPFVPNKKGNFIDVTDKEYGAIPDDGKDDLPAFEKAVADARKQNKNIYIPEGTFHLSNVWRVNVENITITGAGMWYTNLQFTVDGIERGGISGGWTGYSDKNGQRVPKELDGVCSNIEFSNMYINSGLHSRYNEGAIYKCFMDVWGTGTVFRNIWEEHFECGFWFGDYNGKIDYSKNVKVIDCRIRNNYADGVNFCIGTSNSAVYNCSIRNNGDDGLAVWPDDSKGPKSADNNIFAYNTIELGWRAGGIAIYGGDGHKIYNNYICDMFMASGIHLNTTFPGPQFKNTKRIAFDNNILVRCGTDSAAWNNPFGAIDITEDVRNVFFTNTKIYDSPQEGVRLDGRVQEVEFNGLDILGSNLMGIKGYSDSWLHQITPIFCKTTKAKFSKVRLGNFGTNTEDSNNDAFPLFVNNNPAIKANIPYEVVEDSYVVPGFPVANKLQTGGIIDPLADVKGYDVILEKLSWKNEKGEHELHDGNEVTFTAVIKNTSNVDIPKGVVIGLKVAVDGKEQFVHSDYRDGLKAGQSITLSPKNTWTAAWGAHKLEAFADYKDKLYDETNEDNNLRVKNINVKEAVGNPSFNAVQGGADLQVLAVSYGKDPIKDGDHVVFTATIVNAGDRDIPAGQTIGLQFQVDNKHYGIGHITWNDKLNGGLKAHEIVKLSATGGGGADKTNYNYWTATDGEHVVTAWVNDQGKIDEVNKDNNKKEVSLIIPFGGVKLLENPDAPDALDGETLVEMADKFAVNGVKYERVEGRNVKVVGLENASAEILRIPANVSYKGVNYQVKEIASQSFEGNSAIKELVVENGVTTISDHAFKNVASLNKVSLPASITTIGEWCFEGCGELIEFVVPNKVETIETGTFYHCGKLAKVVLSDNVKHIGTSAFDGCSQLNNVEVSALSKLETIDAYAFQSTELLKSFNFPVNLTTIGHHAFKHSGLSYVQLPVGLQKIDEWAFEGCKQLRNVSIPAQTQIGAGVFYNCSALQNVTLPSNITTIPFMAFSACSSLEGVYLTGSTVPNRDAYCFDNVSAAVQYYVKPSALMAYKSSWNDVVDRITDEIPVTLTSIMMTFSRGFDVDFTNASGLEAKIVTDYRENGGQLEYAKIEKAPANTGLILTGRQGTYIVKMCDNEPNSVATNLLKASVGGAWVENTTTEVTNYICVNGNFVRANGVMVQPWSAWLRLIGNAHAISNGTTTAINEIEKNVVDNEPYYRLDGTIEQHPSKGIFIHKGKKVILK